MIGHAEISEDGLYRYTLSREWLGGNGRTCLFIMLNPSTADALEDDPTIRRCIRFAQLWGFSELSIGNLFAYRATDPKELAQVADPVGSDNDLWLERLATAAEFIVVAWGATPLAETRVVDVIRLLQRCGHQSSVVCLGTTAKGAPRHPLYVKGDKAPELYRPILVGMGSST